LSRPFLILKEWILNIMYIKNIIKIALSVWLSLSINSLFGEQVITIIDAANLGSCNSESVRAFAEKELHVPVILTECSVIKGHGLRDIAIEAVKVKKKSDTCLIVFGATSADTNTHLLLMTNELVAVINVLAVTSTNIISTTKRLQRLTMRAAASLFGICSDPDPYCVMHDYKGLDELDRMGMNFSPPWGGKFRQAAKARGMTVRPLYTPRQKPVIPAAVPAVPLPASGKIKLQGQANSKLVIYKIANTV
jgi:hypothetical protein